MVGFADWRMAPAMAAGLERLGWQADEPAVREVVPAVLRGGNVVAVLPPAPAWASPVMAGLLGQQPAAAGAVLVLAAPALVSEWAIAIGALTESAPLQIDVARTLRGAAASSGHRASDILIASPATALDRHANSDLYPDRFRAVVFAWPDEWHGDEAVAAVLQDCPRDTQRIVLTAHPEGIDGTDGVVERYARKALIVTGMPAAATPAAAPRDTSVRTVATSWTGRASAVAAVLEAIDRPTVTIWTADRRDHQLIQRALGSLRDGVTLTTRGVPETGLVICYDPPSAEQLARLTAAGEVVLLVPPGCEQHVERIAPTRRPMHLESPANAVLDRDAALRREIAAAIEAGDRAGALYALAPLFERFDPQLVAAATFGLWRATSAGRPAEDASVTDRVGRGHHALPGSGLPAGTPAMSGPSAGTAKLWIGAGKKDEATVGDFVAVLIKEAGMDRSRIGRIELRDTFALVEVPAEDAEGIAQRLVGLTIRKRKLSARVDRGRGGPGGSKAPGRNGPGR